jgi:iron-sulfur cluster repair protein YtfE (RIC family)
MVVSAGHQHHAVLVPHVDALRQLADEIHDLNPEEVARRLVEELDFIGQQLLPHMEMAERTLYPQLELLLGDPQAMEPMRREHAEVHRLLGELAAAKERLIETDRILLREEFALVRALYRLFSLMRVHLHEEEHYLEIIEHNEPASQVEALRDAMRHAG